MNGGTGTPLHVHPGDRCPTCERRVPFPKVATSPKTQTFSYRVPVDEAEVHRELLDAWAEHWGILGEKHHLFKLVMLAAVDALAGPPKDLG